MAKDSSKKFDEIPIQNIEENKEELNNESYHNEARLLNISFWSNIFSWVILVIYMLNFLATIISEIGAMGQGSISNHSPFFLLAGLYSLTDMLMTPAMGFLFFLILQAISQSILMLMDIEEKKS